MLLHRTNVVTWIFICTRQILQGNKFKMALSMDYGKELSNDSKRPF